VTHPTLLFALAYQLPPWLLRLLLQRSIPQVEDAKAVGAAEHRAVPKQIEYWARIGKAVLENPELPLQVIQDTMLCLEETKAGQLAPYSFGQAMPLAGQICTAGTATARGRSHENFHTQPKRWAASAKMRSVQHRTSLQRSSPTLSATWLKRLMRSACIHK
jgi:hypothetical protein